MVEATLKRVLFLSALEVYFSAIEVNFLVAMKTQFILNNGITGHYGAIEIFVPYMCTEFHILKRALVVPFGLPRLRFWPMGTFL